MRGLLKEECYERVKGNGLVDELFLESKYVVPGGMERKAD